MRDKLLLSFRCKLLTFLCRCQIFPTFDSKRRLWKSASAPTAGKTVKTVDQFQLAMAAPGVREL